MPSQPVADLRPADFDAYWGELLDELATQPIAAEATELPLRSDDDTTCYAVKLTGWGGYRLFGYLSIPKNGSGPFPAYYYLPRYLSVMEVVNQGESVHKRRDCITFSIACRGQRNADQPLIGRFPGMLTDGVEDRHTFSMRGWVADCVRGLEYLLSRPEVDAGRIAGVGYNDFALLAAALKPALCCVTATPGFFYRTRDLHADRHGYPIEEINDYVRCFPDHAETLYETFSYFDPRWFADKLHIPCLLWGDPPQSFLPTTELMPLAEAIGPNAELRVSEQSRSLDGMTQEHWLADRLGLESPTLPQVWTVSVESEV
ncbi:MAG: acetylxylan esterase [Planctomycetaceae bacterium]